MSVFEFKALDIDGAYIVTSFCSEDERGSFVKSFEKSIFSDNGIDFNCSESFISVSHKNVIRGMHFQTNHPQAKLVGVLRGKVFDVLVDLRKESLTCGQWRGYYLSSSNRTSLLIPRGCAHGFMSLSDDSMMSYQCDGAYDWASDTGISYLDSDIAIEWPIKDINDAIVSSRDRDLMLYSTFINNYDFTY